VLVGVDLYIRFLDLVDKILYDNWVSIAFLDLFRVNKSDIFQSMYLSKAPEKVISVFADSLDFEVS